MANTPTIIRIDSTGIARKTSHAPCVNFVTVTIRSTSTVNDAPSELITSPVWASRRSAPFTKRSSRRQCLTMPIWPSENETKTPMM